MRRWNPLPIVTLAIAAILAVPLGGQAPAAIDRTWLSALKFREIGPTSPGGRLHDFAVGRRPGHPAAVHVSAASGGALTRSEERR